MINPKQHDAELILKLYELRTAPAMRTARQWYVTEFEPAAAEDIRSLMLSGFDTCAKYRMVTTYWEMAATLVNSGGIDEQMFLQANTEHLIVFCKIEPFIEEVRELFGEPDYLLQLQQLIMRIPDAATILAGRRRLLKRWQKKQAAG